MSGAGRGGKAQNRLHKCKIFVTSCHEERSTDGVSKRSLRNVTLLVQIATSRLHQNFIFKLSIPFRKCSEIFVQLRLATLGSDRSDLVYRAGALLVGITTVAQVLFLLVKASLYIHEYAIIFLKGLGEEVIEI